VIDRVDAPVTVTCSPDDLARMNRWALVASVVRGTVHCVNNILQTIGGQAELLLQQPDDADGVRRRMDRVVAQTARAAGYMRELSAVVRDAAAAPDRCDVRPAVDRVHALREYDLARERIAFEVQSAEGPLPAVTMDQPALCTVLLNLILNAEQALAGSADPRITLTLERRGNAVVVGVCDNGPGVAAEARDRVFDPFFTTGRPGAALGLGLPVSRRLAEAHGGRLALAEDPVAGGARIELTLPASG
jgi:two-component system NtrC family sensor kinase